jgi:pyrophosphate--fructose-6-phosphate 1-phosphotransferase
MKKLIHELNDFLAHNQEEFNLVRRSGQAITFISKLSKKMPIFTPAFPKR